MRNFYFVSLVKYRHIPDVTKWTQNEYFCKNGYAEPKKIYLKKENHVSK